MNAGTSSDPSARACLNLPGESTRELWVCDRSGEWKKSERSPGRASCIHAIGALALDSMPFWAHAPQEGRLDAAAIAALTALKWEAAGIPQGDIGKSWMHWKAGEDGARTLVASAALSVEAGPMEVTGTLPTAFELAPRLYPIPPGEIAVWKELGRLVVAFMRHGTLAHFSVLSAREPDADAALEVRDLAVAVESHGFIAKPVGVRVWTDAGREFVQTLKEALGVRVRVEPRPSPRLPETSCDLLPPEIARAARDRRARARRARLTVSLALLYILGFGAWAGWLFWREKQLTEEEARLARLRPKVEEVRQLQSRWETLDSATNVDAYPVEIFQRVVSLLPEEGISFKEFHYELDKVIVSGEASSVAHAKKFQADLTGNEGLRHYTWNFPQPTILDDNRASFRAEGALSSPRGLP